MPANTVYVGRPSKWGNMYYSPHKGYFDFFSCHSVEEAVGRFRRAVSVLQAGYPNTGLKFTIEELDELKGKDIACWCAEDAPCHGDILLEIANKESE